MSLVNLKFKDMEVEVKSGKSFSSVFSDLSLKGKEKIVGVIIDGVLHDLHMPIKKSGNAEPVYIDSEEGLHMLRHSTSHIMAQAVKHLYPHAKLSIGPSIKDGFYYDFDFHDPISSQDLEQIEDEMKRIIEEDQHFERFVKPRKDAISLYKKESEEYKVELINDLGDEEELSFYKNEVPYILVSIGFLSSPLQYAPAILSSLKALT